MKTLLFVSVFSLLFLLNISAQVNWTKYANNPVFTSGPAFYDLTAVGQPTVIIDNDTIKMWYSAVGGDMKSRIGYAWSLDGINWTKHTDMVLNTGYPGEWDSEWLDTPEILKVDSGYLLYYYGDSIGYDTTLTDYEAVTHSAIGLAFSTDGINWIKEPSNPVFTKGNTGDWDATWIESPALFRNDTTGELMMWYNGADTATWKIQIGLATSPDGIHWTKYAGNPVIQNGNMGTYDDMWLGTPAVIFKNDHFEIWYSSAASADFNATTNKFDTLRICLAKSDDGIHWIKYQNNPLFNTGTSPCNATIDAGGPWAPDVIYIPDSNQYKMWFEAAGGFLLATSDSSNITSKKKYLASFSDVNVYPNPASSELVVELNETESSDWNISLLSICGNIVYSEKHFNGSLIKINATLFSKGIYLLEVSENNGRQFTKKIIIE